MTAGKYNLTLKLKIKFRSTVFLNLAHCTKQFDTPEKLVCVKIDKILKYERYLG